MYPSKDSVLFRRTRNSPKTVRNEKEIKVNSTYKRIDLRLAKNTKRMDRKSWDTIAVTGVPFLFLRARKSKALKSSPIVWEIRGPRNTNAPIVDTKPMAIKMLEIYSPSDENILLAAKAAIFSFDSSASISEKGMLCRKA